MSSLASEGTSAFGSSRTGTVTTITSDHTNKKTNKSNRYSLLQLRPSHHQPTSNSSEDNISLGNASTGSGSSTHRQSRLFQNGLKFLDHHLRPDSRQQQPSGNRTPASRRSQSPGPKTSTSTLTSFHASTASDGSVSRDNISSPAGSLTSSSTYVPMTKDEFESLPPTIQRKYFSTLERLRFAQGSSNIDIEDDLPTSAASLDTLPRPYNTPPLTSASHASGSPQNPLSTRRLTLQSKLPSESVNAAVPQRTRSALVRQRSSPAVRLSQDRGDDSHTSAQPWRRSVILDATDEAFIKRKRQTIAVGHPTGSLYRPASADHLSLKMHSRLDDQAWVDGRLKETENSLLDSFKWLESDGDLDLRLNLDDYHVGLRKDAKTHRKSHSSSFRRNLSISSKLAFGRTSTTLSPPPTRDATTTPPPFGGSVLSLQSPNGHVRRRSRALSLMSAHKQPVPVAETPASPQTMDPAAHYQDPDARMKLRVYLGSPHKFDEAVEFGFPSSEQSPTTTQESVATPPRVDSLPRNAERAPLRMQTLVEDKRCSVYSDGATASESDSPRTPDTLEKPTRPEPPEMPTPKASAPKVDYAQAPASSREMTLRMTLTRPDLRANEEQLYGWQKTRPATHDGPRSPTTFKTDDELKKDSIERELAAIDQENVFSQELGTMKRFWNRVRRG